MGRIRTGAVERVARAAQVAAGAGGPGGRFFGDLSRRLGELLSRHHGMEPGAYEAVEAFGAALDAEFGGGRATRNPSRSSEDPTLVAPSLAQLGAEIELAEEGFPPTVDDVDL
jgi:hypothetical protein